MFRLILAIVRENKIRAKTCTKTLVTTVGTECLYKNQHLVSCVQYKSWLKTRRIKMLTTSYQIAIIHVHTNMQYSLRICIQTPTVLLESLYDASPGKSGLPCALFTWTGVCSLSPSAFWWIYVCNCAMHRKWKIFLKY